MTSDWDRLEAFRKELETRDITPEEAQAFRDTAAKYAKKYGKGIPDILVEIIRSGDLDDGQREEAINMLCEFRPYPRQ